MRDINVTRPAPVRTIATAERFGVRQPFPPGAYTIVGRTEGPEVRDALARRRADVRVS
jgi:hypothetical protein